MRLKDKPPCASFAAQCPVQAVQICRLFERFRGHRHGSGRITAYSAVTTWLTIRPAEHIELRDEIEPFRRISGELQQFRKETAQRKKYVAWFVPPARLWKAGDLGLQDAQLV